MSLSFQTLAALTGAGTSDADITLQLQAIALTLTFVNQQTTRIGGIKPPGPGCTPAMLTAWATIATQSAAINATAVAYNPTGGTPGTNG